MMFELDVDKLKEQGAQLMDSAKKTALDLAGMGKNQLDLLNQQAQLSKAQRQLGALVYSLHKSGEENQPLVTKYIEAVDAIETAIEGIKAKMTPTERAAAEQQEATDEASDVEDPPIEEEEILPKGETKTCPVCNAQVDAEALFCNHCGAQL